MTGVPPLNDMRTTEARLVVLLSYQRKVLPHRMHLRCKRVNGRWRATFEAGEREWTAEAEERRSALAELEATIRGDVHAGGSSFR